MHQPEHVEDQSVGAVLTRAYYKRISTEGTLIFIEYCLWHDMSKREKFVVISHRNFVKRCQKGRINLVYYQR